MLKNFIDELKLNRISYLLEIIEVRDIKSKIKAYNKIRKMKITKEAGLLIINRCDYLQNNSLDFNITISLLSLLFKEYHKEYSPFLIDFFDKLSNENRYEILNLSIDSNNKDALILYKDLILKYGKELIDIPISYVELNKDNYEILFPALFKALKLPIKRNNIILLLNDFLINNLVPEKDIKKNKKIIQEYIINVFKDGINYKFKKDENIMQNKDYINLRIYLETAINVEFYVSNTETKKQLDRLFKKRDNQLKLFILENYVRKGKDISKINLNLIAKDLLSRYPLFSFLMFYNLERLMPKKYANNLALSESDLYINYSISNRYNIIPYDMEFIEERIFNNYKYYIYKFTTDFNYDEEVKDPATDYILKNTNIDKIIKENSKTTYIGMSGGYNKELDPSLIEKSEDILLVKKYDDDNYEALINSLLPKKEIIKPKKKKVERDKKVKEKQEKLSKDKLSFKEKIALFLKKKDKKDKVQKVKKEKIKKEKKIKEEVEEEKEPSLLRIIFSFDTLLVLVFLAFLGTALVLYSYINGMDILNMKKNHGVDYHTSSISEVSLKHEDKLSEINYVDIYKKPESEYYVLLYNHSKKNYYNYYLNTILGKDYKFYYVDTDKEENKPIYGGNETGFIISEDTLLKVKDGDYDFYVVSKTNILKEMKDYVDEIKKQEAIEEARKKEEEQKRIEEEKKSKIEKEKEKDNAS